MKTWFGAFAVALMPDDGPRQKHIYTKPSADCVGRPFSFVYIAVN